MNTDTGYRIVYSSDSGSESGLQSIKKMITDLINNRELIWCLINRDIKARYKQTWLGYLWAVLPQIVTVSLFTFLISHRVFAMGETELPYVIHALWSVSFWQFFAICIINSTQSLTSAGPMIKKINFCKESLVFASVGSAVFDFLIRLIPVIAVFIWYGFLPSSQIFFIPVIIIVAMLMALGIGFITSILNLVIRDIGSIISILMTFGIFLTPVLYPPPVQEPFALVNILNPFSPLLISTQEMIAGSFTFSIAGLVPSVVISLILFIFGWKLFQLTISRVAERA